MTETRRWLEARRSELNRFELSASVCYTLGATLVALGIGVGLGRVGWYQQWPVLVVLAWLVAVFTVVAGVIRHLRRARELGASRLAERVERERHLRRGSILGLAGAPPTTGSPSLVAAADKRAVSWLTSNGREALAPVRRGRTRAASLGLLVGAFGAVFFVLSGPATGKGTHFWSPLGVLAEGRGPVRLAVDREEVRRGEMVVASVAAPGRRAAILWVRAPGEAWRAQDLTLDTAGLASIDIGPLDSDRFLRAVSGNRSSDTLHVRVAFPAFIADLALVAVYPAYLERPDDVLFVGDSVVMPVGTRLIVRGRVTVPVSSAAWQVAERATIPLRVDGNDFSGRTTVRAGGTWELVIVPESGQELEGDRPVLHIAAVRDSVPTVAVPVPGVDTVAPLSLKQPLVIDVRDDHRLTLVEVVSRRVSRAGLSDDAVTQELLLPMGVTDRAVLQWILDLNDRGFLPGDTAFYKVRAYDNAPDSQSAETREFILRLPSTRELRQAVRDAAEAMVTDADSLLEAQRDLESETLSAAAEQERREQGRQSGDTPGDELPFESAERAREIGDEQSQLLDRAQQLSEELRQLSEAAWEAGVTDAEWQEQMENLRELLEQAVTEEMLEALESLREALEQLDPESLEQALQDLTEAQERLREQLERSRELFERAALEGTMSSLAQDAEELADQQEEWNRQLERAVHPDSVLAAAEEALAQDAERLEQELQRLQEALERTQTTAGEIEQADQQAGEAARQMQQAAQQASQGQRQQAQQSGEAASESLEPMAESLRRERDRMREEWREEVLEAMDQALTETAELARNQQDVAQRLQRGETGGELRGDQAAVREGVDRLMEQLQNAAGKNALVSPDLGAALGFSRERMTDALSQLQQGTPNARQAADGARQALEGLNALAFSLLRSRSDVAGSQSGSGFAEAMERMAEMARQQEGVNGQTGSLLPLMPSGSEALMQELQTLAQQQRALAEELERLSAEGLAGPAEELSEEALDVARELEAGRLDRRTIERQERLFRRMLDAGRTLRSDEEDDRQERMSETAQPDNVRLPPALQPGATGEALRFPYPGWEELRLLSPEERRIILDYFRRLNAGRRP